jgi:hypothetical protein
LKNKNYVPTGGTLSPRKPVHENRCNIICEVAYEFGIDTNMPNILPQDVNMQWTAKKSVSHLLSDDKAVCQCGPGPSQSIPTKPTIPSEEHCNVSLCLKLAMPLKGKGFHDITGYKLHS